MDPVQSVEVWECEISKEKVIRVKGGLSLRRGTGKSRAWKCDFCYKLPEKKIYHHLKTSFC